MLKQFTLKNNLKVATYSIPQMRSVFLAISVKGGSLFDAEDTSGAAHFMEHILVQAIPSFPTVEQLSEFIEGLAGRYNASTSPEIIRFNASGPAEYTDDLLKIAAEVFYEPLFKEDDIERERGAVLEEIRERNDSFRYKNYVFFRETRFKKGSPMLLDTGGNQDTVEKIQKTDLVNYWQRFFDPSNSYLVVVGGFNPDTLESSIEKIFQKYPVKKQFEGFAKSTNQELTDKIVAIRHDDQLNSCYLTLSFPSISGTDSLKKRITNSLARNILANFRTSRLYSILRQKKGLVYSLGFGASRYQYLGYDAFDSQMHISKLEEVLTIVNAEIAKFMKTGPTDKELAKAKNYSKNQTFMQFDHPMGIGSWIEDDLVWEDKIYTPEEYVEIVESITKKDILDSVKQAWDFSKLNLVIQGPLEDSAENKAKFADLIKDLK